MELLDCIRNYIVPDSMFHFFQSVTGSFVFDSYSVDIIYFLHINDFTEMQRYLRLN